MNYEIWYKDGAGNERRIAAFHYRFHAEKFIECESDYHKKRFILKVIE